MDRVRRVITGCDVDGRSTALVEEVASVRGPAVWYGVWGWDEQPSLPGPLPAGYEPISVFPPPGGARVAVLRCPPGMGLGPPGAADPEFHRLYEAVPPEGEHDRETGVHWTHTVDVAFILAGEIELELEADAIALRTGDVVVQNGTVHAWRNRGPQPCLIGIVNLTPR